MHPDISVVLNTRHRIDPLEHFTKSFISTTKNNNVPHLTVLYHNVKKLSRPDVMDYVTEINEFHTYHDNGLCELWNKMIMASPTDWIFITQDDMTFNEGWVKHLEKGIEAGKFLQINFFSLGAFLMHKSLIPLVGWFDERYCGGGFEDIDWQLRMFEAGLKPKVDRSHDYIKTVKGVEIGHFVCHHRRPRENGSWRGKGNSEWICKKWGRPHNNEGMWNWKRPSYRRHPEIDFHPTYTKRYAEKFDVSISFLKRISNDKEIYKQCRCKLLL